MPSPFIEAGANIEYSDLEHATSNIDDWRYVLRFGESALEDAKQALSARKEMQVLLVGMKLMEEGEYDSVEEKLKELIEELKSDMKGVQEAIWWAEEAKESLGEREKEEKEKGGEGKKEGGD